MVEVSKFDLTFWLFNRNKAMLLHNSKLIPSVKRIQDHKATLRTLVMSLSAEQNHMKLEKHWVQTSAEQVISTNIVSYTQN